MMLLRTLVLERSGQDAPVNGALLCGFAVPRLSSNFLAYSLDEETEPGSARVYIAALRRKADRYFLGSIDNQDDLQTAMLVFKQILTLAASGARPSGVTDAEIAYHFVDLKGCKLPPARTEDHHSLTIKKALVMKVITLGTSVAGLPAIESHSLIVPSIRFSSQMVSPPRAAARVEAVEVHSPAIPPASPEVASVTPSEPPPEPAPSKAEPDALFEVDTTLTSLARVAQELTQQKLAVLKQEDALEQARLQLQQEKDDWRRESLEALERSAEKEASLALLTQTLDSREEHLADRAALQQQEQARLDAQAHDVESQLTQLRNDERALRQREHQAAAVWARLPGLRDTLREVLHRLDDTLAAGDQGETNQPPV
ncbi:hypothetical protein ACW9H6_07100 [Pseudomonas sp. SDO528_S397]